MVAMYLRRAYSSFATHVLDVPPRLLSLLCFLFLLAFPVTKPSSYLLVVLVSTYTYAIFAASWDLLVGRCGQMSLGHSLFFGVGAYVTALLFKFYQLPIWVTIPLAVLVGALVAVLVGFPCLRVKGPYLALVSMVLPLILTGIVFYFGEITGGENGIWGLPRFFPFLKTSQIRYANYYLSLAFLFVSSIILYKTANSKTGIVFVSILDDELASKACGINVTKYKLMAFVISAVFASLAGAVYAHFITAISPLRVLSIALSFEVIMQTVLGGMGTISGPVVGTIVMYLLDQVVLVKPPVGLVNVPAVWHLVIFITVVIIFIIKWPRGIAKFVTDKLEDFAEAREIDERGPHIWKKYKRKKESTPEG